MSWWQIDLAIVIKSPAECCRIHSDPTCVIVPCFYTLPHSSPSLTECASRSCSSNSDVTPSGNNATSRATTKHGCWVRPQQGAFK